jgi:hypothetical protein
LEDGSFCEETKIEALVPSSEQLMAIFNHRFVEGER